MGVSDESARRVVSAGQEVAYVGIPAVAQVQQDVLGQGGEAIVAGGLVDEGEDVEDLSRLEVAADLDRGHLTARLSTSTSSSSVDTVASSGRAGTKR